MLKKRSELSSMPVILQHNKKQAGLIQDVILSKSKTRVVAYVISNGGILKSPKIVTYRDIVNIGKDFLEIKGLDSIKKLSLFPEYNSLFQEDEGIIGSNVISSLGKDVGYVRDYIIDMSNGKIYCFILSEGFFDDMMDGRQIMPYCEGMVLNNDTLVIKENLLSTIQNTKTGGLNNLLH